MTQETQGFTQYNKLAQSIVFQQGKHRTEVVSKDASLTIIGSGRSAYVFRLPSSKLALKVFYPPFEKIARKEAEIYQKLKGVSGFPNLICSGENFIVIDYLEGDTLFECLVKGVRISSDQIAQIDQTLLYARKRGLNPSDIHLHNIIVLKNEKAKIIDVARFQQMKQCSQWDDMKYVFYKFYIHRFFPKKIPRALLNLIAILYKRKLLTKLIR
ncbi:serine/threonine protein kinase [Sutcliffiella halmapala]|uniref:serine/threonine protein kinase n=1 Tax=Sutcliffiella halmapala TaxID=79882 RepID=UPI0009958349|nr:serine/threonine protein kinase [Sutcliffiella halmapala]